MKNNFTIEDQVLKDLLVNPKLGGYNKSHYISDCPFCGKERHFYINRKTYLFDCKKCPVVGNIFKLLLQLGRTDLSLKSSIDLTTSLTGFEFEVGNKLLTIDLEEDATLRLPLFFKRIYKSRYLIKERGFQSEDFNRYYIGKSKKRKYKGYVLFVVEENNECKGIVGRAYESYLTRRYKNTDDTKFGNLLYGIDEINESTEVVILVEGIFDKIKMDKLLHLHEQPYIKCVATFGKKVSETQIVKLLAKGINKLIYFYDPDAIKEMKNYSLKFSSHFAEVEISCLNKVDKDIDDSKPSEVYQALENSMPPTEFFYEKISFLKH